MQSLAYWNPAIPKATGRTLALWYNITGTTTVVAKPTAAGIISYVTWGAIGAQTTIDNFLGTTSEFTIAQYDATSMGTDAMGIIVNMGGQCADVAGVYASIQSSTTYVPRQMIKSTTLTDSSLTTECAVGASGNLGIKIVWGNSADGFATGSIVVFIHWLSK